MRGRMSKILKKIIQSLGCFAVLVLWGCSQGGSGGGAMPVGPGQSPLQIQGGITNAATGTTTYDVGTPGPGAGAPGCGKNQVCSEAASLRVKIDAKADIEKPDPNTPADKVLVHFSGMILGWPLYLNLPFDDFPDGTMMRVIADSGECLETRLFTEHDQVTGQNQPNRFAFAKQMPKSGDHSIYYWSFIWWTGNPTTQNVWQDCQTMDWGPMPIQQVPGQQNSTQKLPY